MDVPTAPVSAQIMAAHTLPRYESLPSFGLYVDQLVSFVNEAVGVYLMPDEKPLTASMVNNYVKLGIMPKPEKKKYTRNHIAYLIAVCLLKKVFSINEIAELIQLQKSILPTDQAYDSFIDLLERSIAEVFSPSCNRGVEVGEKSDTILLVERAVSALSNKLFIQIAIIDT